MAQAIFEPNLFPYKYFSILKLVILHTYPPMQMKKTGCTETSAYKIHMPMNYPKESIQNSERGKMF
jgi:hypothetical protein